MNYEEVKRVHAEWDTKEKVSSRLEANRKILDILKVQVESNPDYRFGQLLYNIGVATHKASGAMNENKEMVWLYRDIFFEESTDTLKKLSNNGD